MLLSVKKESQCAPTTNAPRETSVSSASRNPQPLFHLNGGSLRTAFSPSEPPPLGGKPPKDTSIAAPGSGHPPNTQRSREMQASLALPVIRRPLRVAPIRTALPVHFGYIWDPPNLKIQGVRVEGVAFLKNPGVRRKHRKNTPKHEPD